MGFEKLIVFLKKNLSYDTIEELSINSSMRKILTDHVIFDVNFIIYSSIKELENEINDILKLILSLPFNYNNDIDKQINKYLNMKHWKKYKTYFESILDGIYELDILKQFKKSLLSLNNKKCIFYDILYEKILNKIINYIDNKHIIKFIKSISIFFDGIPSYSKILEQTRRRLTNYLESQTRKKVFSKYFSEIENNIIEEQINNTKIYYNYFEWLDNKFNINKSHGPTSDVYLNLENFLNIGLKKKYNNKNIDLSSGEKYGEADLKIFKYIHKWKLKGFVSIHTCDSDLIHESIIQQLYLKLDNTDINFTIFRYYFKKIERIQLININKIILSLEQKYIEINKIKTSLLNKNFILDLMIILYFFGNDILPSSIEIGPELKLSIFYLSHYQTLSNTENLVNINNNIISLNLINLKKWLKGMKIIKNQTLIILNRYYRLPYDLIYFFINQLNINILNLIEDFMIPYYIYQGYKLGATLETSDIRYIFYNKYKQENKDKIPQDPLDLSQFPDSYNETLEKYKKQLLLYLDFYDIENYGIPLLKKIQILENNSYQDLYNYINKLSIKSTYKKYPYLYKNILYNNINDVKKKIKEQEYSDEMIESYLKILYYQVQVNFNNLKKYNPCNFIFYSYDNVPNINSIIEYINKVDIDKIYKKWNNNIKSLQTKSNKYFDYMSHHLFITPYLKNSTYINKITNIPSLNKILNIMDTKINISDDNYKNYRKINPIQYLKYWNETLLQINLNIKNHIPKISYKNKNIIIFNDIT